MKAASPGRGIKGAVAWVGQAQVVAVPYDEPVVPGSGPSLQLPPQGCGQGLGGITLSLRSFCVRTFPAACAPHCPLAALLLEIP